MQFDLHFHAAAVKKLWRRENAAFDLGHLAANRNAEFLSERICRKLGASH